MKLSILCFGQVAAITGNTLQVEEEVATSDELLQVLQNRFPALQSLKYSIAIDKKLVQGNTPLTNGSTVAILPPFSGG